MNANIKVIKPVDDLQEQFRLCEQWNDSQQWDWLALAYFARGYLMNALYCFKRADALRDLTPCPSPIGEGSRVAVETE